MDHRVTLDLNRLSVHLLPLRGLLVGFVRFGAFALLLLLLGVAAAAALRTGIAGDGAPRRRALAATVPAAGLAYLIALLVATAVGRSAPALSLAGVTVLVREGHTSLPDPFSAAAAALACGLTLARGRLLALLGALVALLEAFAVVIGGAAYLTDALAGIALGVAVAAGVLGGLTALGRPQAATVPSARRALISGMGATVGPVVGPASQPEPLAPSGSVTILSGGTVRPRTFGPGERPHSSGYVPSS